jgi:acylphosphatase
MSEKKRVHALISGRVQGVFFRMETLRAAEGISITGWVRNRPDGTVEAVFEGDAPQVDQLIEWCKNGPPMASVLQVKVSEESYTGKFKNFSIR